MNDYTIPMPPADTCPTTGIEDNWSAPVDVRAVRAFYRIAAAVVAEDTDHPNAEALTRAWESRMAVRVLIDQNMIDPARVVLRSLLEAEKEMDR